MTAHRARSAHSRRSRTQPARPVPAHLAHLHPDWLPPGGYDPDGAFLDPADDLNAPTRDELPANPVPFPGAPIATPTGLPREFNSRAGSSTTIAPAALDAPASGSPPPAGEGLGERSARYGALPWVPGSSLPPPDPDHPADEDAIFRNPHHAGSGREREISSTALPLRHRIYALHCQGRSISAIARQLCLDRGTVARHLHATEDLLLAEQTADLGRLRLRAVEAQHAILAACWDALLCEELNESDASNDRPYPARRAQLLGTAARAARTAAQLQGLFTPSALAAALHDAAAELPTATAANAAAAAPSVGAHGCAPAAPDDHPAGAGLPVACNSTAGSSTTPLAIVDAPGVDPAASCGMPASDPAAAAQTSSQSELPREFNSRAGSPPPLPAIADPSASDPAAFCGMPAIAAPPSSAETPAHVLSTPPFRSVSRQ